MINISLSFFFNESIHNYFILNTILTSNQSLILFNIVVNFLSFFSVIVLFIFALYTNNKIIQSAFWISVLVNIISSLFLFNFHFIIGEWEINDPDGPWFYYAMSLLVIILSIRISILNRKRNRL